MLGLALLSSPACRGQATPSSALAATARPGQTITGTVFDPAGAPAPGVEVWVTPGSSVLQEVKSDAGGRFTIPWQPVSVRAGTAIPAIESLLWGRDVEHNFAATVKIDEKTTNTDLHLQEGFTLSGSLLDANGAAAKTASVRILMMTPPLGAVVNRQPATVNEQGVFTISALPRGRAYRLVVTAPGFGAPRAPLMSNETQTASLRMRPIQLKAADQRLEGKVVGPDDKPVPGAVVRAVGTIQPEDMARTDTNGHFALKVCEGQVRVMASAPASLANTANGRPGTGTVQTQAGDLNVVVKLGVRPEGAAMAQPAAVLNPAPPSPPAAAPPPKAGGGGGDYSSWMQQHTAELAVLVGVQAFLLFCAAVLIVWLLLRKGN